MNSISGFEKAALVGAGYGITLPILMPLFAMITVAAIPRIINLYEGKVDVRPIITKFLGYYILVALPLVTVMSLYSLDMAHIFIKNPQMYEASQLVPYFAYGVFFLAMTDYTTLQYHLANKTHIEFTIKLISGIIGVGLNFALIPKLGLAGVGIATFAANFLYCLLSMIIVIPNLNLRCPTNMLVRIFVALIPATGVWYCFKTFGTGITGIYQIVALLLVFYLVYFFGCRKFIKLPE